MKKIDQIGTLIISSIIIAISCNQKSRISEDEIIGHYFTPHAAHVNIDLNKDNTFLFNNVDSLGNALIEKGTYKLKHDSLIYLNKSNKSSELFIIKHDKEHTQFQFYNKDRSHFMIKPY